MYYKDEMKKFSGHIKGLGVRHLCVLLSEASPTRFPTVSKFLSYCGYKASVKKTKKYNRVAKSTAFQIAQETVMHRDKKYYPLFVEIKERFKSNGDKPIVAQAKALNRIATLILKEIYYTMNGTNERR